MDIWKYLASLFSQSGILNLACKIFLSAWFWFWSQRFQVCLISHFTKDSQDNLPKKNKSALHNNRNSAVVSPVDLPNRLSRWGVGPWADRHAWEATPTEKEPSGDLLCSCWDLFTRTPKNHLSLCNWKVGDVEADGHWELLRAAFLSSRTTARLTIVCPEVSHVPVMNEFLISLTSGS